MKKKIIITAANGFLGKALVNFMKDQYEVIALVRKSCTAIEGVTYRIWDGKQKGKWFEDWLKENGTDANDIAAIAAEKGSNVHNAIERMLNGDEPVWIQENGYVNYSLQEWKMIIRFADFWNTVIYHLKKRENDFREFESLPENQIKSVKEVRELFDKQHQDILKALAKIWNKILTKASLEFDYENAKNPIQLTDNLQAYIRLKNSKEHIGYNQLSTGIRNFIFKLGHIYALYFNRNVESGFLLVDEPENSLFPDFLYDLVDVYTSITKNTQIFMATHNPIIAAQFQPYERFILEFEEGTGHVKVRRGTTPVGDDPNDILIKDFGIRSILGREGVAKWERYIELKTLIPLEHDPAHKNSMLEEFMQIGSDYNFAADAVS